MAKKSRRAKPSNIVHVKDLKDADRVLAEIAGLKRRLAEIDLALSEEIDNLKAEAAAKAEPLKRKLEALEGGLLAYAEYNKPELFRTKKSVELNFGMLGYRQSTRISIKKTTLENLLELGFEDAVRIKKSVDREELRAWPDERLELVEAKRIVRDEFWYEVKEEELSETG